MTPDYINFTESDFISDEYFQRWVKEPDHDADKFWNEWMLQHPDRKGIVIRARLFLENLQFNTQLPSFDQTESSLQQSLKKLAEIESTITARTVKMKRNYFAWAAAAVTTGAILFLSFFYLRSGSVEIQIAAGKNEIKTVLLPDSSVVVLNAGSKLSYQSDLRSSANREVWLEGEGFFEIKKISSKGESHRFTVHSNKLNVEVLGTSFNIRKRGDLTNVTLNTGKIKIDVDNIPGSAIEMQPGDFVQYSDNQKRILKKRVDPEMYSVWKENKIELENTSLSEIVHFLEDVYGFRVEIKEENLSGQKISGTMLLGNEDDMLKTLSLALNIDITKEDSLLIFQSKKTLNR
jgi:ferric-dicitrate binding protein FerR (iron transport regulator)